MSLRENIRNAHAIMQSTKVLFKTVGSVMNSLMLAMVKVIEII